jgi:hypothetical protein
MVRDLAKAVVMLRKALIVTTLVFGVAACASGSKNSSSVPTRLSSPRQTPTTVPAGTMTTVAGNSTFKVGEKVKTALGNTITVYSYVQPVPPPQNAPPLPRKREYAAADIEFCLTGTTSDVFGTTVPLAAATIPVNSYDFELQMPDNSRVHPTIPVKDPDLNLTTLSHGECVRGWVSWQVRTGVRPRWIIDSYTRPPAIRWQP